VRVSPGRRALFLSVDCGRRPGDISVQHEDQIAADAETAARGRFGIGGVLAWVGVGVPFCIGLYIALKKAAALF
jgi:hypothetical protein